MILGFSTRFPKDKGALAGKKTNFIEKIWKSLEEKFKGKDDVYQEWFKSDKMYKNYKDFNQNIALKTNPKRHTIRKDEKNRWKEGNDIHFKIGVRTKNNFQFAPVVPVTSVQEIEIKVVDDKPAVAYTRNGKTLAVFIDGRRLRMYEIDQLATNDGFENTLDFFGWFNEDFKGKIIHWTNLKY